MHSFPLFNHNTIRNFVFKVSKRKRNHRCIKEGGAMMSQNLNVHVQSILADSSPEASIDKINWTYSKITIMWITGKGILLTHLCPPTDPPNKTPAEPHLLPGGPDGWPFLARQPAWPPQKTMRYSSCTTLKCLKKIGMVVLHFCKSTTRIMNNSDLMQNQQIHGNFTKSPFLGKITLKTHIIWIDLKVWNSKWPAITATLMCYF